MKPFKKSGGKTYQVRLYDEREKPRDFTTGTRDKASAVRIAQSIDRVRDKPKYRPIYAGIIARTFTPEEVWEADERNELDALLNRLEDVDVQPLVTEWHRRLTAGDAESGKRRKKKVTPSTADGYLRSVRMLIPDGAAFPSSRLNADALQEWLDDMDMEAPNTVRNRGIGVHRFVSWLVRPKRILEHDPFNEVELPPPGKPRCHYLETDEAIALADAQPGIYRLFSATLHGTGIEVSTARERIHRRDVMKDTREIRAAGTKTYNRDRIVRVADWAWPYVLEAIDGLTPSALVFQHIPDRWYPQRAHNAARAALVKGNSIYDGYTMRDARHTWAVRAVRSGWPIEAVSRQLGHVDGVLALKVYGRFVPQQAERDRWEAMATARDQALREAK